MIRADVNLLVFELRRRGAARLTALALALCASMVLVLFGLQRAFSGRVFGTDDPVLIVSNRVAPVYPLPSRYAEILKTSKTPVAAIAALTTVGARVAETRTDAPVLVVDGSDYLEANPDLQVADTARQRWLADPAGALVGREFADQVGVKVGDRLKLEVDQFNRLDGDNIMSLRVEALYDIAANRYPAYGVVVHERYFAPFRAGGLGQQISLLLVKSRPNADPGLVAARIDDAFRNEVPPTRTTRRQEYIDTFNNKGGDFTTLALMIGALATTTGSLLFVVFSASLLLDIRPQLKTLRQMGYGPFAVAVRMMAVLALFALMAMISGCLLFEVGLVLFDKTIRLNFPLFDVSAGEVTRLVVGGTGLAAIGALAAVGLGTWRLGTDARPKE